MKYTANDINKMKVSELRRLVSENSIFKGGLSNMKKSQIIDKIYNSPWWQTEIGNMSEKEQIELRLAELQKQLEEQQLEEKKKLEPVVEQPEPVVEQSEPVVESVAEPVVESVTEPESVPESEQKQEINVDEIVQQALQKQREEFMKRIFG